MSRRDPDRQADRITEVLAVFPIHYSDARPGSGN